MAEHSSRVGVALAADRFSPGQHTRVLVGNPDGCRYVAAGKILFLLPYGKARYEHFRSEAKHIPRPLPDFPFVLAKDLLDKVTHGSAGLGTLRRCFILSATGPRTSNSKSTPANVKRGKKIVATLKAAMVPVVGQLGITWGTPP